MQEAAEKGIAEDVLYIKIPYCENRGTKSRDLVRHRFFIYVQSCSSNQPRSQMEEADEIIDELLNKQGSLLWKWRNHLVALLTRPLTTADDDDADGQEYARSLETQVEAEAYLQAYSALLADRREVMTAERTLLAVLDVKEKKARRTKASRKAATAAADEDAIMSLGDIDPQPEHDELIKELQDARKALLEDFDSSRAMRSVMIDLNNVAARITREEDPEKVMARSGAQELRTLISDEGMFLVLRL